MKNLLFFLWVMFAPIVEDISNYIIWKTKGLPMPEGYYEKATVPYLITIVVIAYLLYEN